ncbi:unnamed protein product, partial [Meganyctiphanes norvegica]
MAKIGYSDIVHAKERRVKEEQKDLFWCDVNRAGKDWSNSSCLHVMAAVLRIRARQFPAIISCTTIDWFHEWPKEALVSVSQSFLANCPELPVELHDTVSNYMAHFHTSVNEVS